MSPNRSCFQSYHLISPKNVILGDDTVLEAMNKGSIIVDTEVKGRVKTITIKDVLHVPKLKANLLSLQHLVLKHLGVEFSDERYVVLSPSREEVAIIHEVNGFYQMKFSKVHGAESAALVQSSSKGDNLGLWHCQPKHFECQECESTS